MYTHVQTLQSNRNARLALIQQSDTDWRVLLQDDDNQEVEEHFDRQIFAAQTGLRFVTKDD